MRTGWFCRVVDSTCHCLKISTGHLSKQSQPVRSATLSASLPPAQPIDNLSIDPPRCCPFSTSPDRTRPARWPPVYPTLHCQLRRSTCRADAAHLPVLPHPMHPISLTSPLPTPDFAQPRPWTRWACDLTSRLRFIFLPRPTGCRVPMWRRSNLNTNANSPRASLDLKPLTSFKTGTTETTSRVPEAGTTTDRCHPWRRRLRLERFLGTEPLAGITSPGAQLRLPVQCVELPACRPRIPMQVEADHLHSASPLAT